MSTKILPTMMIIMTIVVIVIRVHNVAVSMVDSTTWDEVESLHFYRKVTQIKAVSGEDDSEKKEAFVLGKFRALLGLRSLHNKMKAFKGVWEDGSPAMAPSLSTIEAGAPAPAPVPALAPAFAAHVRSHPHRPPEPRPMLTLHKFDHQHRENGKRKRIIIAASVMSTGVAMVICALGLVWIARKLSKQQKGATRTASLCRDQGGFSDRSKSVAVQNLVSKVSHDPDFDVCYIDTITALEPQECFKGTCEISNLLSAEDTGCASHERKDSDDEATKSRDRDSNSFLAEEIISAHEYAESSKYESDDQNFPNDHNLVSIDPNLSDDESFHSLSDSHSPSNNLRLSNVSLGSFSDPMEVFSPNHSNRLPSSTKAPTVNINSGGNLPLNPPDNPLNKVQPTASTANTPQCLHDNTHGPPSPHPPPPPPPPPPPSLMRNSPSHSHKTSTRPQTSSTRSSNLRSGSNQTPEDNLSSPTTTLKTPEALPKIPPPPCPPFPNGHINSFKGPPPPPIQLAPYTPLGKDGAPLPKLKPLHWDKVRAAPDRSMVWDKLRCSSFELDEQMIESLFGYNLKNVLKNDEGKNKSPSPSKHVLEPKRLQNITILSKALNVTAEKVCEALVQGDGLCSQQLEALVKMTPTEEEEIKLANYKGDINELGSAEKLVKEMLTIPYAFQRIEAMLYRATFDDEVVHLRNSFSMLQEACKELRSNRLFLKLLEAVLKTGNRMNVGTIRGGARAFKLDALLKLADVKGTDGNTTLLHFVVQEIMRSEGLRMSESIMGQIDRNNKGKTVEEREDDYRRMGLDLVSGLSTELCNVKRTASIDLDVLATSVSNLSDGMSKLRQLVNKDSCKDETNDNFVHAMKIFLSHAEKNLKELQAEEDKVLLSVRQITEYYHGDVSKDETNPLRIFVVVRDFLGMLDQVCRELKSLKTPRTPNPLAPFR